MCLACVLHARENWSIERPVQRAVPRKLGAAYLYDRGVEYNAGKKGRRMVGISAMTGGLEAVSVSVRLCRYCGKPLPDGSPCKTLYCSITCRRHYQDARRKAERDEVRSIRQGRKERAAWADPWSRCDVDEWTAEEILANALLDPLPAGLGWEEVGQVKVTSREGAGKNNEIMARLAKRKARRKSRRERRRKLRGVGKCEGTARLQQGGRLRPLSCLGL